MSTLDILGGLQATVPNFAREVRACLT